MEISVRNLQKRIQLNPRRISRIARTILRSEGVSQGCLSIVFVSSQKIKSLNKKYHNRDYATDVLAFDLRSVRSKRRKTMEAEIVICAPTAARNAKIYRTKVQEELILCVVHGILHLLGFDDHKPADVKRMRRKEQELLAKFKS